MLLGYRAGIINKYMGGTVPGNRGSSTFCINNPEVFFSFMGLTWRSSV